LTAAVGPTAFGRNFQNPIMLAAGTAGFGLELEGVCDLSRLGGLVTKSVSLEPREGNPAPRVTELPAGMLNSVGLANPGVRRFVDEILPLISGRWQPARLVISVVGFTRDEYRQVVEVIGSPEEVAAIEINLSCPNTSSGGVEFGSDPLEIEAIVGACRGATNLPLIAKLPPSVPDIVPLAAAARDSGADGVALVNTLPGRFDDPVGVSRLGRSQGGVSGPALLPIGLLATSRVAEFDPDLTIVGVGGVRSATDAERYLAAGATLVAIGTAGLADPRLPIRVARALGSRHG